MIMWKWIFMCVLVSLSHCTQLRSMMEPYEEDVIASKKHALISRVPEHEFFINKKAAITVCTTTIVGFLFPYDHVALAFEMPASEKEEELSVFLTHFGGDGDSSLQRKDRPIFDCARDTLRKVLGGQRVTLKGKSEIPPMYRTHMNFVVDYDRVTRALQTLEREDSLTYSLLGWSVFSNKSKTYNCVSYADRVLRLVCIGADFDRFTICTANHFLKSCADYQRAHPQNYAYGKVEKNVEPSLCLSGTSKKCMDKSKAKALNDLFRYFYNVLTICFRSKYGHTYCPPHSNQLQIGWYPNGKKGLEDKQH